MEIKPGDLFKDDDGELMLLVAVGKEAAMLYSEHDGNIRRSGWNTLPIERLVEAKSLSRDNYICNIGKVMRETYDAL